MFKIDTGSQFITRLHICGVFTLFSFSLHSSELSLRSYLWNVWFMCKVTESASNFTFSGFFLCVPSYSTPISTAQQSHVNTVLANHVLPSCAWSNDLRVSWNTPPAFQNLPRSNYNQMQSVCVCVCVCVCSRRVSSHLKSCLFFPFPWTVIAGSTLTFSNTHTYTLTHTWTDPPPLQLMYESYDVSKLSRERFSTEGLRSCGKFQRIRSDAV